MGTLADVVSFAAGVVAVLVVVDSAVRTFVLPRAAVVPLTRLVWAVVRAAFVPPLRLCRTYEARDRVMALYAPVSLLALPLVWLVIVAGGFTLVFHAVGVTPWGEAFATSGSSLLTLGFDRPPTLPGVALSFVEAAIGLAVLALLIAYLPTIYASFSRRELSVARLVTWAGSPPSAVDLLVRAQRIHGLANLDALWREWEEWFAWVEETHTSLAAVAFLRSPRADRSWVTAAGAVLDAASFTLAVVDVPWQPHAALCIRSGFLSLRSLADAFGRPVDHDPRPTDPIAVRREEWDEAVDRLVAAGVPVAADRDAAWRDWSGWRVNYDRALVELAGLTAAPYAPWSSDRSLAPWGASVRRRHGR